MAFGAFFGLFLLILVIPMIYLIVVIAVLEDRPISRITYTIGVVFGTLYMTFDMGWGNDWAYVFWQVVFIHLCGVAITLPLWGPTLLFIFSILGAFKIARR